MLQPTRDLQPEASYGEKGELGAEPEEVRTVPLSPLTIDNLKAHSREEGFSPSGNFFTLRRPERNIRVVTRGYDSDTSDSSTRFGGSSQESAVVVNFVCDDSASESTSDASTEVDSADEQRLPLPFRVSVPRWEHLDEGDVSFHILVESTQSVALSWSVMRTFSEFYECRAEMSPFLKDIKAPFPEIEYGTVLSDERIEERRLLLSAYLGEIASRHRLAHSPQLLAFLHPDAPPPDNKGGNRMTDFDEVHYDTEPPNRLSQLWRFLLLDLTGEDSKTGEPEGAMRDASEDEEGDTWRAVGTDEENMPTVGAPACAGTQALLESSVVAATVPTTISAPPSLSLPALHDPSDSSGEAAAAVAAVAAMAAVAADDGPSSAYSKASSDLHLQRATASTSPSPSSRLHQSLHMQKRRTLALLASTQNSSKDADFSAPVNPDDEDCVVSSAQGTASASARGEALKLATPTPTAPAPTPPSSPSSSACSSSSIPSSTRRRRILPVAPRKTEPSALAREAEADSDSHFDLRLHSSRNLSHNLNQRLAAPLAAMQQHQERACSGRGSTGCTTVLLSLLLDPLSLLAPGVAADEYVGETNEAGRPHGKGCLRRADGSIYTGDFFRGEATGKGVITYPQDGECCAFDYDGEVLLMEPQGKGRAVYSLAATQDQTNQTLSFSFSYEGDWDRGMANGRGVVRSGGDVLFVGRFRESRPIF